MTPAGLLLIDKPEGPSSHEVVAAVRRELGLKRVGHTGTLDPFATGLLLICVGWATRLVEYFHVLPKFYEACVVLGERRDTDDLTGVVVARSEAWRSLDRSAFEATLHEFQGIFRQRPPDYSARRQHGHRAYRAARKGKPLDLESRTIEVSDVHLLNWAPPRADVGFSVSTGTYIRAIARDLGERLGCHAHLGSLRRTMIGAYHLSESVSAGDLAGVRANIIPPFDAVSWLPRRELSADELNAVVVGRPIPRGRVFPPALPLASLGDAMLPVALHAHGQLAAIGELDGDLLKPAKVFHAV